MSLGGTFEGASGYLHSNGWQICAKLCFRLGFDRSKPGEAATPSIIPCSEPQFPFLAFLSLGSIISIMAGVGEASAIVGLIATAARLSKAVIDIAGKYKDARKQIESFGHEVAILGNILDQMYRLLRRDHLERDIEVYSVMATIVNQCSEFFSELDVYKDTLYSRQSSGRGLTFRGKTKWVFEAADLEYLRARLESMKTNLLLMMTMQCMHSSDRYPLSISTRSKIGRLRLTHSRLGSFQAMQENTRQIQLLALQSDACVRRLETLEEEMIIPASNRRDSATDRMSIMTTDTAMTARSMRESIMSLYGHQSYYQIILDPREGSFDIAPEMLIDHSTISMIIEHHQHPNISQSFNLSGHGKRESFIEDSDSVGGDTRNFKFFDHEFVEAERTETLWDTVFKDRENKRSTPSERSIASASTVLTRASNVISIAFIPGVTKRSVDVTPPSISATLTDKPLPSLPKSRPPDIDLSKYMTPL